MKPIIGLMPLFDDEKDSYWMLPGYMEMLQQAGAFPIMLPLTENEDELNESVLICDGLLFTGGHDVNPVIYGSKPGSHCGVQWHPEFSYKNDEDSRKLVQAFVDVCK